MYYLSFIPGVIYSNTAYNLKDKSTFKNDARYILLGLTAVNTSSVKWYDNSDNAYVTTELFHKLKLPFGKDWCYFLIYRPGKERNKTEGKILVSMKPLSAVKFYLTI